MRHAEKFFVIFFSLFLIICQASGQTDYYSIFLDGSKVGYCVHSRNENDQTVTTNEKSSITISRFGIPIMVTTDDTYLETKQGLPLSFDSSQLMSGLSQKIKGTVNSSGKMQITTSSIGQPQQSTVQWPKNAVMLEGARLLQIKNGLKEGTNYQMSVYVPNLMQAVTTTVLIGPAETIELMGEKQTAYKTVTMMQTQVGQLKTISWVDSDFNLKKSLLPFMGMQFEMVACTEEAAMGSVEIKELSSAMFVDCPVALNNVSQIKSIGYRLVAKKPGQKFSLPQTDNQRVTVKKDGVVYVAISPVKASEKYTLPMRNLDTEKRQALQPTPYLQSDNVKIKQLAKQAVGNTKNAAQAARKIESFTSRYITLKDMSVGYASAAEVAQSRQGDCTEFAVLATALCRAAGIPARVVIGIAYIDEFEGMFQKFGGHAWYEAWIGNKWVGYDAAFKSRGQGYDPGHIALSIGDSPGDFLNLAALMGKFNIDKVIINR